MTTLKSSSKYFVPIFVHFVITIIHDWIVRQGPGPARGYYVGTSGKLNANPQSDTVLTFAVYIAPQLASRRWVNSRKYGSPAGIETTPPVLNTGMLAIIPLLTLV